MRSPRKQVWIAAGTGVAIATAIGAFTAARDCLRPLRDLRVVYERVETKPDRRIYVLRFKEPIDKVRANLDPLSTTDTFLSTGSRHESLPFQLRTGETARLMEDEKGCMIEVERPHPWIIRLWGGVKDALS